MKTAFDFDLLEEGVPLVVTNGKPNIFALHCVKANTEDTIFIPFSNTKKTVTFPKGSFVKGAIYPYTLYKIKKLGGAEFIGLRPNVGTIFN
jgi:hypothetical protein